MRKMLAQLYYRYTTNYPQLKDMNALSRSWQMSPNSDGQKLSALCSSTPSSVSVPIQPTPAPRTTPVSAIPI